jgi:signal peptidase I
MTDLDGPEDGLPGGGQGERVSPEPYDPLFGAWEPSRAPTPRSLFDDDLFAALPAPAADDEELSWQRYRAAETTYPDRYVPEYQRRLTDLQRRLREETIVLPRPERRWTVTIRELTETLLLAVLIFLAVRASFQNFRVEGASMEPSLDNGEYLIVNKLSYAEIDLGIFDWIPFFDSGTDPVHHLWGSPSRGDVIVFRAPTSINRDFIKRIIGLPGDTVDIVPEQGQVKVNDQVLSEPYIQGTTACGQTCQVHVPDANTAEARASCGSDRCYFVMGDNRQNSSDSRQNWLVPEENIIGKAVITYWHNGGPEIDLAPNHSVGLVDQANAEQ